MECLVTKLKGTVNDESILKIGEWRIPFRKYNSSGQPTIYIALGKKSNSDMSARIVGDAYFSDSNGTANNGTTINAGYDLATFDLYIVANGEFDVIISNKYNITSLGRYAGYDSVYYNFVSNLNDKPYGYLNNMYAAEITISDISWLSTELILLGFTNLIGNIEDINIDNLKRLIVYNPYVYKNSYFVNTESELYGSISNILKKGLTELILNYCKVTGKITDLNTTALKSLSLEGCIVSGDISNMSFSEMSGISLASKFPNDLPTCGYTITGDVCKAAKTLKSGGNGSITARGVDDINGNIGELDDRIINVIIRNTNGHQSNSVFTYTKSALRTKVLRTEEVKFSNSTETDNFLKDMAILSESDKGSSNYIILNSSRTSESDDAVATLQRNGYIVQTY